MGVTHPAKSWARYSIADEFSATAVILRRQIGRKLFLLTPKATGYEIPSNFKAGALGRGRRRRGDIGDRFFSDGVDPWQHGRTHGGGSDRERARQGAGADLRREIPTASQLGGKADRVQEGCLVGSARPAREGWLGNATGNRNDELSGGQRLRRKAWPAFLRPRSCTARCRPDASVSDGPGVGDALLSYLKHRPGVT